MGNGSPLPASTPTWATVPPIRMAFSDHGSVPRRRPPPPGPRLRRRSGPRPAVPIRVLPVVQSGVQTHPAGPLQLLVARQMPSTRAPRAAQIAAQRSKPRPSPESAPSIPASPPPPPAHSTPSPPRRAAWPPPESSGARAAPPARSPSAPVVGQHAVDVPARGPLGPRRVSGPSCQFCMKMPATRSPGFHASPPAPRPPRPPPRPSTGSAAARILGL